MTRRQRAEAVAAATVFCAGLAAFAIFVSRTPTTGVERLMACAVFGLLFMPCPVLSVERWAGGLRSHVAPASALRMGALWILLLAVVAGYVTVSGSRQFGAVGRLALYGAAPIVLVASPARARMPFRSLTRMGLAIAALWLPMEFRLVHGLSLPAGAPGAMNATPIAVLDLALLLFVVGDPVPDLGFTFIFERRDLRAAAVAFAAFAAVAIPLGLGMDFIRYHLVPFDPLAWLVRALSIYFSVALPEELLFRGLLQNAIEKRWPGERRGSWSLAIAALVFGAAHLNHPPVPNVRYAALASLAGLAYGWTWRRSRKVTASALTHAAVDLVWSLVFRGR